MDQSQSDLQPALFHLTGPLRGTSHVLEDEALIGTAPEADLAFPSEEAPGVDPRHLELRREEDGWHFRAAPEAAVLVNGEPVISDRLLPADVLQLGPSGPLLRFRLEPAGERFKSLRDALADCVACARYGADSVPARVGLLLETMPRELLTQTSPWTRTLMVGGLALGLGLSAYQAVQSHSLGDRLSETQSRLEAVASSLRAEQERKRVTPAMLDSLRRAMADERDDAGARPPAFLDDASRSVLFVQGAYTFEDPATGRILRVGGRSEADGERDPATRVTPDADGTPLVRTFTGTAFAVTARGHFVTNRHLVRPWDQDPVAESLEDSGYRPVFRRLTGYLPEREPPLELAIVAESDSADVALLQARGLEEPPPPLALAGEPPAVGKAVYLLGYPTGVKALLARSDPQFVASLREDSAARDLPGVVSRLAAEGAISPLTTRGIVGQVSGSAVVYDAETSQGGSGGPVLSAEGRVVAVNRGVMAEFGGANLGVPARHIHRLLERAGVDR